jgi:hypothetical protein
MRRESLLQTTPVTIVCHDALHCAALACLLTPTSNGSRCTGLPAGQADPRFSLLPAEGEPEDGTVEAAEGREGAPSKRVKLLAVRRQGA